MEYITHYSSRLGVITLASDGTLLTGLWFDGQKYYESILDPEYEERHDLAVFDATRQWLDIYFSGRVPQFVPPLEIRGSAFRRRVGEVMLTIPYGHTMTYGDIARIIAQERGVASMSAQAVGGAVGHNPISLIIPCHRVVGVNGALVGYGGGIERKAELLRMERLVMSAEQR